MREAADCLHLTLGCHLDPFVVGCGVWQPLLVPQDLDVHVHDPVWRAAFLRRLQARLARVVDLFDHEQLLLVVQI